MSFTSELKFVSAAQIGAEIESRTPDQVLGALNRKGKRSLDDFKSLISPAAIPYLENMARLSRDLTQRRFGKTIQMYAPVYLSNECQNICTYCGFSYDNKIPRRTLTDSEIELEFKAVRQHGFEHVLLVTGEANKTVGVSYLKNAIQLARKYFSNISIEVQPLYQSEYDELAALGLYSVLVYQETYHEDAYALVHPKGKKSNFQFRLDTPERLGKAGVHKIGLGVLIGLADWKTDSFFCAMHQNYLERRFWKCKYSISFPRLRPHEGEQRNSQDHTITEKELTQLICAYRIFNEDLELSLSTRESETFRDHVLQLGITTMSAGSKTNPGGYVVEPETLEQFSIDDDRSPAQVAAMIRTKGYEPLWKDWDQTYQPLAEQERMII